MGIKNQAFHFTMFKRIATYFIYSILFTPVHAIESPDAKKVDRELSPQINDARYVNTINFSPDGKTIATTDQESTPIRLWDVHGYFLRTLHHPYNKGVKFSNSGRFLASYDSNNIIVWNPKNGKQLNKTIVRFPDNLVIMGIDFNPDDSLLAIAGQYCLGIWDLKNNTLRFSATGTHDQDIIRGVYFAAAGNSIVTYSRDTIKIRDLQGRVTKEWHVSRIVDVFVHKAGREIICSSNDTVTIWNLDGELLTKFSILEPARPNLCTSLVNVAYLQDTDTILTLCNDRTNSPIQAWTRQGHLLWEYLPPYLSWENLFCGMAVSPDGKTIALKNALGPLKLLDTATRTLEGFLLRQVNPIYDFTLFPKDDITISSLRTFDKNGSLRIFDKTGKLKTDLNLKANYLTASPDGTALAISSIDKNVYLFDQNWKQLNKFPYGSWDQNAPLSFSPDSKKLAMPLTDWDNRERLVVVREISTGRILSKARTEASVTGLQFLPDGKTLLIDSEKYPTRLVDVGQKYALNISGSTTPVNINFAELWDYKSYLPGAIKYAAGYDLDPTFFPRVAAYDAKTRQIAVGGAAGGIKIMDFASSKFIRDLPNHLTAITRIKFSPDGSYLFSSSSDGILKTWNTKNWNYISSLSTSDNEWLIYTPDGYFDASPHGGDLVAMVDGLKGYGIEQFAARNNRPDLILERMGLGTPEQLSHYQFLYQKRLKKLGLTEALLSGELHVPEARITKTARNGKFLNINFSLSDDKYFLKRYNIFVNNVPLLGPLGSEIRGNRFEGTKNIELTAGKNKIEISAMNEAGAESYRAVTYADYEDKEKRELYYLAFGVSKYKDTSLNLNYADKDAKDLEAAILQMRPAYTNVHTKTFLNSDVTAENMKKAKAFLNTAGVDDTAILFLAGHGGYDKGRDPKYYYLPYEANRANLPGTGVVFEDIEDLLNGIKPRKKLFLLDTCESGELEEDVYTQYYTLADARGFIPRTSRKPVKARGQAAKNGRGYLLEKDRYIFNDLTRRSGAIVFSSSRGDEISYESQTIQNGFFSREIINALKSKAADIDLNGKVSIDELKTYVSKAVSKDTGNLQNPTIDRDNLSQKIELPLFSN